MKGVKYVTDEHNNKVAVQIEMKVLEKYIDEMEDLLDGIVAESKKDEERIPLSKVISNLKKKSKLN